jgi:hypothetical protein
MITNNFKIRSVQVLAFKLLIKKIFLLLDLAPLRPRELQAAAGLAILRPQPVVFEKEANRWPGNCYSTSRIGINGR